MPEHNLLILTGRMMGRRHEKTGGIKLVTVKPERREITKSLTEFFSVRTDIPPEVVCASFGDHCMELLPPWLQRIVCFATTESGGKR